MRRLVLTFAAALLLPAGAGAQPANLAEIAGKLPPLPRHGQAVALPLRTDGPYAWQPVRAGISLAASPGGLTASYRVASGQAAGAALIVPPGTLAGVRSLRLRLHGTRSSRLTVVLRDAGGVAYAFPAVGVRVGDPREAEVFVSDLSYLAQASAAPDPGSFDPAQAVMITLVDAAGLLSRETPEVAWTVTELEGILS